MSKLAFWSLVMCATVACSPAPATTLPTVTSTLIPPTAAAVLPSAAPISPTATSVPPTATTTSTPTHAPTPTNTPTLSPTATPTATPTPDLAAATITLKDLPAGFRALSPAEAQQMGATASALAGSFGTGRARNFAVFLYSDPRSYELIALLLVYPLSTPETAWFDLQVSKHEPFCQALSNSPGLTIKSCQPLQGTDEFKGRALGASIGATTTINLRVDIAIVRRGTVAAVVYGFYSEGTPPPIGVIEMVRLLDARVATAVVGE